MKKTPVTKPPVSSSSKVFAVLICLVLGSSAHGQNSALSNRGTQHSNRWQAHQHGKTGFASPSLTNGTAPLANRSVNYVVAEVGPHSRTWIAAPDTAPSTN